MASGDQGAGAPGGAAERTPDRWPGSAYPLGATYDGFGTNLALFSEVAERVELCLFDDAGRETRIEMGERDAFVWHCFLPRGEPPAGSYPSGTRVRELQHAKHASLGCGHRGTSAGER